MEHRLHIRKKTPILSLGRACTELSVLLRFVFAVTIWQLYTSASNFLFIEFKMRTLLHSYILCNRKQRCAEFHSC